NRVRPMRTSTPPGCTTSSARCSRRCATSTPTVGCSERAEAPGRRHRARARCRAASAHASLPRGKRARQLLLVHLRAPADAQRLRALVQFVARAAVVVDAAEALAPALLRGPAPLLGARVRRTLVV